MAAVESEVKRGDPGASPGTPMIRACSGERRPSVSWRSGSSRRAPRRRWSRASASPSTASTSGRQEQGLPQNTVQAVLRGRDGYLWVGTQEGLVRFDGARFTTYDRTQHARAEAQLDHLARRGPRRDALGRDERRRDPLPPPRRDLRVDRPGRGPRQPRSSGRIAFDAVGRRLGRRGRERSPADLRADGPSSGSGRARASPSSRCGSSRSIRAGALWVGTTGKGVAVVRAGRVVRVFGEDVLGSGLVRGLAPDADGGVWVATSGGGLTLVKDGVTTPVPREGPASPPTRSRRSTSTRPGRSGSGRGGPASGG